MWFTIKRLSRGLLLIAAAAGVLLASDSKRRGSGDRPQIAIFQHASTPTLDEGVQGMIDGLAENGYRNGETADITIYNAQGEMTTANNIALQITDGRYDLVLTSSTMSMLAVANVNRAGHTMHVFGLVADPFGSGVGLDRDHPLAHPRHMVGYGSFLPVEEAFRIAKRMLPTLRTVGVAWNPAEPNSRIFVEKAKEVCRKLDINLIEAQVDTTAGIRDATLSLLSRGAQAVWVGGDVKVASALDTVIAVARQERIPVFSVLPGKLDQGTIFDVGLDFHEVGRLSGQLAAEILKGKDPTTVAIRNCIDIVPHRFVINQKAFRDLKDPWQVPVDVLHEADIVVDDAGVHRK